MLLSTLYVDNGDAFSTISPVVSAFDYATTTWSRRQIIQFFDNFRTQDPRRRLAGLEKNIRIQMPVGIVLMELVSGRRIDSMLTGLEPARYFELLPELLLQVLLMLNDMQIMLRFVHYDLHPGNLMVEEMERPVVLHYQLNNAVSYNIKTKYVVRMLDFGSARLEWADKAYYTEGTGYTVVKDGSTKLSLFRPWVDQMTVATRLLAGMTTAKYADLPNHPQILALFKLMVKLDVDETSEITKPLANLQRLLSKMQRVNSPSTSTYSSMQDALRGMFGKIYDPATVGAPTPSPQSILEQMGPMFSAHRSYKSVKSDLIIDMSLQVGHRSAATYSNAKALEVGAGLYGWMSSLVVSHAD